MTLEAIKNLSEKEIKLIVKCANDKIKKEKMSIAQLGRTLNINYSDINRVLNGKLISYTVLEKLDNWINEE